MKEVRGDMPNVIADSFIHTMQATGFWQAMAMVTIISTMIGSIIYNGDVNALRKAIIAIFTYGGLIMLTNIARVWGIGLENLYYPSGEIRALYPIATIVYVTFFYIAGIYCGVCIHKRVRK